MRALWTSQHRARALQHRARGFTLIEMVSVIVILALLAGLGGKFVVESTLSYQTTQTRSRLVNTGRLAIERMSRQLRAALPYSVRITNAGNCVEFMPIASGGNYVIAVPDTLNGAAGSSTILVSPHTVDFGSALYVSIGAMSAAEVYGASAVSRAGLSSRSATQLNLSAAKIWQRNSIAQRFYLLDAPQAFCVVGNELRFYGGLDVASASVNTGGSYSVMAASVAAGSSFSLTAGSENRNVNVLFNLTFSSSGESVPFTQSVMIRNVP